MAKWVGSIGFATSTEDPTGSGIWVDTITAMNFRGDSIRTSRRLAETGDVNDSVVVSNQISIIANPFAINNFHNIRYATFMSAKWKVTSVEVQYPRLILTLGGVYNDKA